MILIIDCFKLVKGAGKSIGIYNLAKTIVTHLAQDNLTGASDGISCDAQGLAHEIIVLGNEHNQKDFDVPGVDFRLMKGNPLNKLACIWWELFRVQGVAKKLQGDRILFPRGYRPLWCSVPDTVLIHDMIPFFYDKHFPGVLNRLENAYIMSRLKASARRANRVITISQASKEDILAQVKGIENKMVVINNGVNPAYPPEHVVKKDYIAAVTSAMPHKNAPAIIKSYEKYRQMCQENQLEAMELRIIGLDGLEQVRRKKGEVLCSEDTQAHIDFVGYVADYSDLCRLIAEARVFLFLSLVEGFGFPPLEAMQLGTPVVCSNRTSLKEVVADAGVQVDPDDEAAVAKALIRMQTDPDRQAKYIERGNQNWKRFDWDSRLGLYKQELFRR